VTYAMSHSRMAGIGYVFAQDDPYCGIDLDHCRDPKTGAIAPWAMKIVQALDTYTEISPSGTGLHCVQEGILPGRRRRKGRIEMYSEGRFFTVTGWHLEGTPTEPQARHESVEALYHRIFNVQEPPKNGGVAGARGHGGNGAALTPEDYELIACAMRAKNGERFKALWQGARSGYPSDSEADFALCAMLAFWTAKDPRRMDRLFRTSWLYRPKWEERRGEVTYGALTIEEAILKCTEIYQPRDSGRMEADEWPEPEPICQELLPVEPLPLAIIPEPYQSWIADVSHRMQVPPDFIAVASIVITGSLIGACCGIKPKRRDDWLVIPNLWGGAVARPSVLLKTACFNEALKPLHRLEAEAKKTHEAALRDYEAEFEVYKAQKEALKADMMAAAKGKKNVRLDLDAAKHALKSLELPEVPIWRRYRTNDTTVEKLGELLKENPQGVLIFRDELIGFLAALDREDRKNDRGFYLEAWNGFGSYIYDRIGRGTIPIENCCVSLLGGIQPAKLLAYLNQARDALSNDGLLQRFQLLVYPDEPETWTLIDCYPDQAAKDRVFALFEALAAMDFERYGAIRDEYTPYPYFHFSDEAQVLFNEWLEDLEHRIRAKGEDPLFIEHLGKYRSLMPSLAEIIHLIEVADGKIAGPVSLQATEQAAAWCEYLESHARRVYGLVAETGRRAAIQLAERIRQGQLENRFTSRDVYRKQWSLLTDQGVVQKALEELVEAGWLREIVTPPAFQQRQVTSYVVNPKVKGRG
jgi:hypothetical protein